MYIPYDLELSNRDKTIQWLLASIAGAIAFSVCYTVPPEEYRFFICSVFFVPTSWPVVPAVYFTLRMFRDKPSGREKVIGWLIVSVLVWIISLPCYMLFGKYFPDNHGFFFAPTLGCIMYAAYLASKLKK